MAVSEGRDAAGNRELRDAGDAGGSARHDGGQTIGQGLGGVARGETDIKLAARHEIAELLEIADVEVRHHAARRIGLLVAAGPVRVETGTPLLAPGSGSRACSFIVAKL